MLRLSCVLFTVLCLNASNASAAMIIGHRGMGEGHSPEPENSVISLVTAIKEGADAVEFDVQLTRDNHVVIAHDPDLKRVTNGDGCISEHDFDYVRSLRLRDGSGKISQERMATLEEVLQALSSVDDGRGDFIANIHLKIYDGVKGDWGGTGKRCTSTRYDLLTRKVLEAVESAGFINRTFFSSFDPNVLDLIRTIEPQAQVGLLSFVFTQPAIKKAKANRYEAVIADYAHITKADVARARKHGVKLFAWTPSNRKQLVKLLGKTRVDGVVTNSIATAIKACAKVGCKR